jgi:hypothetical protein
LVNGLVNIEIWLELVNSLVGLCLTPPTLSMLRQVHISVSQAGSAAVAARRLSAEEL